MKSRFMNGINVTIAVEKLICVRRNSWLLTDWMFKEMITEKLCMKHGNEAWTIGYREANYLKALKYGLGGECNT